MPLKLNLTVPNKAVHAFIGLIVLTVIASGVYAYIILPGPTPDPGHALSTIQGFFQGDASLLDSLGKVQQEVSGACAGQVIVGINADGTVICEADDIGIGDITAVNGGSGLTPNSCLTGPCTLNVNTGSTATTGLEIVSDQVRLMDDGCAANEVLKRNATNTGWECVADDAGGGGLNCTTRTASGTGTATAVCLGGEIITGGGCRPTLAFAWVKSAYFSGNNYVCSGLAAGGSNVAVTAYARCCQ